MPNPVPESIWTRFLTDNEEAIARSAPREPSARERAERLKGNDHVGDTWFHEDAPSEPAWCRLDTRGRIRRLGRVLAGAAALAVLLGLFSCLPEEPVGLPVEPDGPSPLQTSSAIVESPTPLVRSGQPTDAT